MNRTKSRRLSRGFSGKKSRRRFEAFEPHRHWVRARREWDRGTPGLLRSFLKLDAMLSVGGPATAKPSDFLIPPHVRERMGFTIPAVEGERAQWSFVEGGQPGGGKAEAIRSEFAGTHGVAMIVGGEAVPLGDAERVRIEYRGVDERGVHQHVARFNDE